MKPCVNLFVEMLVPDPALNFFVRDRHKLDDVQFLAPDSLPIPPGIPGTVPGEFTRDQSVLDGVDVLGLAPGQIAPPGDTYPAHTTPTAFTLDYSGRDSADLIELVGAAPPGFVWLDFTSTTMNVDIDRRLDTAQSISSRPIAGVMKASIVDPYLDALSNQTVTLHTQVRIRAGAEAVFMGEITDIQTEYDVVGVPTVHVNAADGIAKLNSVMMTPRPAETYRDRVNSVVQAGDITGVISGAGVQLTASDKDRTALETLHLAQDSEGSMVWIDRVNHLHALQRGEEIVQVSDPDAWEFSDDHTLPGHHCLVALRTGMDTREVINNLQMTNLEFDTTDPDPTRHRWTSEQYVYTEPKSERWYGVAEQRITTTLDGPARKALADHAFALYSQATAKVSAIEYVTDEFTTTTVPDIVKLDLADIVRINVGSPASGLPVVNSRNRVGAISHRITPQSWTTQLALI